MVFDIFEVAAHQVSFKSECCINFHGNNQITAFYYACDKVPACFTVNMFNPELLSLKIVPAILLRLALG